jgi:predicted DNA binding CopG/RHH family protein
VKFTAAARAPALQGQRVNTRLSLGDGQDLQAKALKRGRPHQTLMASVRRSCVTGRLAGR